MNTRRTALHRLGLGLAACAPSFNASSQTKLLILIVSASPGGALDTVARRLAEGLRETLGHAVIVDNKPGVGGQLALVALKQQAADGNTFALMPPSPFTIFPSTYAKLPYDTAQDFAPIAGVCSFDFAFAIAATHPARTLQEFAQWCKSHPREANLALFGLGSTPHFLGWSIANKLGIELEPVPYKGTAQMAQETAAGQVACTLASTANFVELHRGGRLRILVITGAARNPQVSDVPTLNELGLGELQCEEWYGFFGRQGVPGDALSRLGTALQTALKTDEFRRSLLTLGFAPNKMDGVQLARAIREDQARWAEVVRRTGFKAQI